MKALRTLMSGGCARQGMTRRAVVQEDLVSVFAKNPVSDAAKEYLRAKID
jgi:hypothetical protein